jgi:hypothetical protein
VCRVPVSGNDIPRHGHPVLWLLDPGYLNCGPSSSRRWFWLQPRAAAGPAPSGAGPSGAAYRCSGSRRVGPSQAACPDRAGVMSVHRSLSGLEPLTRASAPCREQSIR